MTTYHLLGRWMWKELVILALVLQIRRDLAPVKGGPRNVGNMVYSTPDAKTITFSPLSGTNEKRMLHISTVHQ